MSSGRRALIFLRSLLLAGLAVVVLLASPVARADVAESLRERWTFLLQHLVNENRAAATALIEELQAFKVEHGIRDLFPEAEIVHSLGMQARGSEQGLGARAYFELARDLAPDLPGPWLQLGLLDLLEADSAAGVQDAVRAIGRGLAALAANPERALRAGVEIVFVGFCLLLGAGALLAGFLALKYARLVAGGLSARLGGRIPGAVLVILLLNLALLPVLFWGSVLLTGLAILAAGLVVGTRPERRWSVVFLVLAGLTPGVVHLLRLTLVLPDLPAIRLYRCELGVCPLDELDRLDRAEGLPRPWLQKVRGDYLSRTYRGDPYIFESARDAYTNALKAGEDDPALWINFGNLLVAGRRYTPERVDDDVAGQAVLLYDRALKALGEDARVLANKSVALDALGDPEGSAQLAERATAIGAAALRERELAHGAGSDRPRSFNHNRDLFVFVSPPSRVFREMLGMSAAAAPRVDNALLGSLEGPAFLWAWGGLLVSAAALAFSRRGRPRSHFCPTCGNVVVPGAGGPVAAGESCATCFYQAVKGTYLEPREAVLLEIRQRARKRRLAALTVLSNLVLPGIGLMIRQRVAAGLMLAALFQLGALTLFGWPRWLVEPSLWPAGEVRAGRLLLLGVLVTAYVVAQLLLIRRPERRPAFSSRLAAGAAPPTPRKAAAAPRVAEPPRRGSLAAPPGAPDDEADVRALVMNPDVPHSRRDEDDLKFLEDP